MRKSIHPQEKEIIMNQKHLTQEQIHSIRNSNRQSISAIGQAWAELLQAQLPDLKGAKVLDAGCGTGFLAILLSLLGAEVTALDCSRSILEDARAHAEYHGAARNIHFCAADAGDTGLPSDSFDAVVSRHTTALLTEPHEAYREWHRLLKPRGILLNFDANWLSPLWSEEQARQFLEDEQELKIHEAGYTDMYHDRFVLMKLSQYPLAFQERPDWDCRVCRELGFRDVTAEPLPNEGLLPPVLEKRFLSIPSFMIKAYK